MQELTEAEITPERGVADDFRGRRDLPWTVRRANLLVECVELPRQAGGVIEIGPVRLEVMVETDPCSRMDEQCPGLREALLPDWRGGVCCRVLDGGRVALGDSVRVTGSSPAELV